MTGRELIRSLLIGAIILVGVGAIAGRFLPEPAPAPPSAPVRDSDSKMSSAQRAVFAEALRRSGWDCEEAKDVWPKGDTAKGKTAKVLCGRQGQPGVLRDRIFNVVLRPNGQIEVAEGTLYD